MAVVSIAQWRINPGKAAQFMQDVARAKAIHERLGARSVRAFAQVYGPTPQVISYAMEFADSAEHGAFNDRSAADPEWQTFVQEVFGAADPSGELVGTSLSSELPI